MVLGDFGVDFVSTFWIACVTSMLLVTLTAGSFILLGLESFISFSVFALTEILCNAPDVMVEVALH